jgi:hypothetical protein
LARRIGHFEAIFAWIDPAAGALMHSNCRKTANPLYERATLNAAARDERGGGRERPLHPLTMPLIIPTN